MRELPRRDFIRQAGLACSALAMSPEVKANASVGRQAAKSRVLIDPARRLAPLDRRLFGSFLEHLGRAIYDGVYDPGNKLSDKDGLRKDVAAEIKAMDVPMVRYPGGNFVSGYHWLDGVGPKSQRPSVLERAWNSLEPNQFGTNEFMQWCKLTGCEPLMGLNFGTAGAEQAAALVEYCNVDKGTKWSDLRRKHGVEKPHNVKWWCLGNEMDGPWQIGHMTAVEYGRKAIDAARQMRSVDRFIQLIACGSSGPGMGSYLTWDQEVLQECYTEVDGISLHRYFNNKDETGGDSSKFVAMNLSFEKQIREIAAVCDTVQGRLKSSKRLWLSFDEWNVWYRAMDFDGKRTVGPHLLEEVYNLEDAILVGGLLNSLIRHSDRVRVGCLAQLVNVIAPIMTNKDGLIRQTIYYPYLWALKHARGAALDIHVESPTYDVQGLGKARFVDVAATYDAATKRTAVFLANRDLRDDREVNLVWREDAPTKVISFDTLTGTDLKASNTFDAPKQVVPQSLELPKPGSTVTVKLPARSYSVLVLE
jgi:alpha-N-arabinofuranosidase